MELDELPVEIILYIMQILAASEMYNLSKPDLCFLAFTSKKTYERIRRARMVFSVVSKRIYAIYCDNISSIRNHSSTIPPQMPRHVLHVDFNMLEYMRGTSYSHYISPLEGYPVWQSFNSRCDCKEPRHLNISSREYGSCGGAGHFIWKQRHRKRVMDNFRAITESTSILPKLRLPPNPKKKLNPRRRKKAMLLRAQDLLLVGRVFISK